LASDEFKNTDEGLPFSCSDSKEGDHRAGERFGTGGSQGGVGNYGKVGHEEGWVIRKREITWWVMNDSRESDLKGWP
jgi:hypothetical protein